MMNTEQHRVVAWIRRREARGNHPNADAVWSYINRSWPRKSADEREEIFHGLRR